MRINSIFFATAIALFVCVDALPTPTSNQHLTLRSLRDRAEQDEEQRMFNPLKWVGSSSASDTVNSYLKKLQKANYNYNAAAAFDALKLGDKKKQSYIRLKAWDKYMSGGRRNDLTVGHDLVDLHKEDVQLTVDYLLNFNGNQAQLKEFMTSVLQTVEIGPGTFARAYNMLHLKDINPEELLASRNFEYFHAYAVETWKGEALKLIVERFRVVYNNDDYVRNMLTAGIANRKTQEVAKTLLEQFKKIMKKSPDA